MHPRDLQELSMKSSADRYKFYNWYVEAFEEDPTKAFPKTIEQIHEMFIACYPGVEWKISNTEAMMRLCGTLKDDMNVVYTSTNFRYLPPVRDVLIAFLKHERNPVISQKIQKALQAIDTGEVIEKKHRSSADHIEAIKAVIDTLNDFYNNWCARATTHSQLRNRPETWRRCPIDVLYKSYVEFCELRKYEYVTKKQLSYFLESKGHHKGKGYACKISGCSYIADLYVPGCGGDEELHLAKQYGSFVCLIDKIPYNKMGYELSVADKVVEPQQEETQLIPPEEEMEIVSYVIPIVEEPEVEPEIAELSAKATNNKIDAFELVVEDADPQVQARLEAANRLKQLGYSDEEISEILNGGEK